MRQTSPLSQVIPPMSKATVPVIFESAKKGRFQRYSLLWVKRLRVSLSDRLLRSVYLCRSIDYSINGFYHSHVTVVANVVMPDLTLSAEHLHVGATPGLPAEAGMRSTITLCNPLNYPASFTWYPVVGESGTAFSIRPASGMYSCLLTSASYHTSASSYQG